MSCHPQRMNPQNSSMKTKTISAWLRLSSISFFLSLLFLSALPAEDWPQWRGPSSNGISSESGLPDRWSASEHIEWQAALAGLGASSPIVWGDKIFVTSQTGIVAVQQGMRPQLARDDQDLASKENPIGGRNIKDTRSR